MLSPNSLVHDRYLIARRVSGDSAGAVYETIDLLQTKTPIVLKQVLVAEGADATPGLPHREAAEHGAQVLAELRHPSLPVVRESFAEAQSVFLAMELVPGDDLATLIERNGRPFPADQVLRWAAQLLDALEYLHTQQPPLIHGDITPQNLKLNQGDLVVLLGLGLLPGSVRTRQAAVGDTTTPASFVPPEQARGAAADQRGDLFALAATLYYLLTRVPPVPAEERAAILARGLPDPLPAPHTFNLQVPPAASAALMQALELDPGQRLDSAAAMRVALTGSSEHLQQRATSGQQLAVVSPTIQLTAPRQRRGLLFAIAGAVVIVLLLAFFLLRGARSGDPPIAGQPTLAPPTSAPAAAATAPPPTAAIERPTAAPAVLATAADPAATHPPTPRVSGVEPQSTFAGTLPLTLTVRGATLDQVRVARLVAEGRAPIDTTIQPADASQLALQVVALPEPVNGAVSYRLELDGVVLESPVITLRDFIERKTVQGIQPQYEHTGRIASDDAGTFTRLRAEANAESEPGAQLRNGDEVEILAIDTIDWYQLRIRSSADAAQIGATGWIERWLIDNQGVPPTPAVQIFAGRVYSAPTDAAVQCGTVFDSSIYGSVEDANGRGISGARLRITSADGKNVYNIQTGRGGVYSVPGLGCTTWTVRLIGVPNAPGGLQANAVAVSNLNGGRLTAAEVRFRQQP
jgi:hypothetical protein